MSYNYNDPKIWSSHYWFVLHTIALNYPVNPNNVCKKKYYNFIQTVPLLIPNENFSNLFTNLLDKFPVTPYLDSRESFIKWVHFIHNKINVFIGKREITYREALEKYYENYIPRNIKIQKDKKHREKYIFFSSIVFLIIVIIFILYNK